MPGHYKKILRSHYNALLQCLHLNGFSPVCILSCTFRFPAWIKALLNCLHLTGFSPVLNYLGTMFRVFRDTLCAEIPTSKDLRSGDREISFVTLHQYQYPPSPTPPQSSDVCEIAEFHSIKYIFFK